MVDRSMLSIPSVVLLIVHNNSIGPTHGIAHCTLTLYKHHHHFSIVENEKKIVNLHLRMVVGSRFHS